MTRILWLAPSFNHYKARFLNRLAEEKDVELTILAGTGRQGQGDLDLDENWNFNYQKLMVSKAKFGGSKEVRAYIRKHLSAFDWILIPAEKKNLLLFMFSMRLRKRRKSNVKLFSYNHPLLKSKRGRFKAIDRELSKFFYKHLDAVVFYTEASYHLAIEENLVDPKKAYWANNTIDTKEIDTFYSFVLPPKDKLILLFIGRLIPSKRVDYFLEYTAQLETKLKQEIFIEIIGDGPERHHVETALKQRKNVTWHGAVVDEQIISPIMSRSSLIFMPGLSGLSINHALAYGRPYATLEAERHGPEISYLKHNHNGFILPENVDQANAILVPFLSSQEQIKKFCEQAKKDNETVSIDLWIKKMKSNLLIQASS
ncbi:glycosyltransferase family 4 protein [uncultured Psychroserpens sp.]|uniref:glycosyltransferase family 4 protein n=1 Tax=uncultured Psychroserpens sp. TaxID=255436 RepID=UPI0026235235|nr:glycosyltransferase family 4 protein [uncultured Psychroserpens sp.]